MLLGGYFLDSWKVFSPLHESEGYAILFLAGLLFGLYGVTAIARIPQLKMGKIETSIFSIVKKTA